MYILLIVTLTDTKLRNLKKNTFTKTMKVEVREFTFNVMMKTKLNNTKLKNTIYRSLEKYLSKAEVEMGREGRRREGDGST